VQIDIAVAMYACIAGSLFTVMHGRSTRTSRHTLLCLSTILINNHSAETAEIDLEAQ